MLRKILVPVRGDGLVETVLRHAATLAQYHRAHIVIAHCRARGEDLMPYGVPMPSFARKTMMKQAQELADQQEQALREDLHRLAQTLDLDETKAATEAVTTVEFIEEHGRMADVIKHNGRLADLIVVAKPDRDRNLGTNSLKSALFQTGRPVLMCPTGGAVPTDFGDRVAIAWNGSLEASRSVALTLDLVAAAGSVVILAGGSGEPHGATAEELVDYYKLRNISAEIQRFDAQSPGAVLLDKAKASGAGLLVMGAYSASHERETLFGGNTQEVVDQADIPVVLAH
ncbi:universal stress protein [Roseobacter sinensis]|uniref:Universal stress protein n=1 Tax=Roseobacter sinensis TaxID=2931391 RepID=A0ABT3BDW8_9RHOB|nr:universal stress protein [Roseobacter sp. WL0113]MCV3271334.1 universal stress protein [Roseobacter sp. WL0113]